jgi:chemotaxis protein methyltransferase WspC
MSLALVVHHLQEQTGLSPEALGPTILPTVVKARMRLLGLDDTATYAAHLASHVGEFLALVDEIVVPETWFFRGGDLFAYLARRIAERVRARSPQQAVRILSVPCSTGEEPYSLAIALHEAGVPATAWSIEGIDLSPRLIAHAQRGQYTDFSFRQTSADLRRQYFRPIAGGWQIDPAIRAAVRFRQGNLLDPLFLAAEPPYDLIFCRNLLIYLTPAARQRVLATLHRLLNPDGWLCMGHAEPLELVDPRFQRVGPAGHFLYQRTGQKAESNPVRTERKGADGSKDRSSQAERRESNRIATLAPSSIFDPQSSISSPPALDFLGQARQQADSGQLADALGSCQAHLVRCGPSAALFSLMGVIHQARHDRDEAGRCFRKALYLQPDHPEALLHLMLLCQEQGDGAQAALLRLRLARIAPGGEA